MGARGPVARRGPTRRGRRGARRRLGRLSPYLLLAFACAVALGVLAAAPVLPIRDVAVHGDRHVARDAAIAASGLRDAPVFRASAVEARAKLRGLPALRDAIVDVALPGSASLTLIERVAAGRWIAGGSEWFVDGDGVVFESVDPSAAPPLRVTDERFAAGRAIAGERLDPALVAAALRLAAIAPGELRADLRDPRVVMTAGPAGLVLRSGAGWEIRFGSPDAFTDKLQRARQFLRENPERRLDYLDVRSSDHIVFSPN